MATYVELKGYKNGENQWGCQNGTPKSSLEDIAKELMSKRNLQRALRIERNLTDSMKELLDTGEITKTFASDNKRLFLETIRESYKYLKIVGYFYNLMIGLIFSNNLSDSFM